MLYKQKYNFIVNIALLASMICFCGCTRAMWSNNPNRYSFDKKNGVILNKSHETVLTDECVLIITVHSYNFVEIDTPVVVHPILQKKGALGYLYSMPNTQIFKYNETEDYYESWQILTLAGSPGQYKIYSAAPYVHGTLYTRGGIWHKGALRSTNYIEAKAGQYVYMGTINADAIGERNSLGAFFAGKYSNFKFSWDNSPENIDFVREEIPQLKDIEIIYRPVTVETDY